MVSNLMTMSGFYTQRPAIYCTYHSSYNLRKLHHFDSKNIMIPKLPHAVSPKEETELNFTLKNGVILTPSFSTEK